MAEIDQDCGELNISKLFRGDEFAFAIYMAGDVTADSFSAVVNGVSFTVSKTYEEAPADRTRISLSLSAAQTAALPISSNAWYLIWTTGGAPRTLLRGTIGVFDR